jgi:hypothetical protein
MAIIDTATTPQQQEAYCYAAWPSHFVVRKWYCSRTE